MRRHLIRPHVIRRSIFGRTMHTSKPRETRHQRTALLLAMMLFLAGAGCVKKEPILSTSVTMELTSSAFTNNGAIPPLYTCDGSNSRPPLAITESPTAAQSFALIVDDPDAPSGDFVHWVVWNSPPDTTMIAEDALPAGTVEGTTDFGKTGWGGPCPPSGTHRYQFKLYALDSMLDLPAGATKTQLLSAMSGHILDQALLVGSYARK